MYILIFPWDSTEQGRCETVDMAFEKEVSESTPRKHGKASGVSVGVIILGQVLTQSLEP